MASSRGATAAICALFVLVSCDPPHPPITLDTQQYRSTCADVGRSNLGLGLEGVLGPDELAAARRIVGVDPSEAFGCATMIPAISARARPTGTGSSSLEWTSPRRVSTS